MNILITGGTGFIGSALVKDLEKEHQLTLLTRSPSSFNALPDDAVFDAIINLAGAPISQRWTKKRKHKLIESRVKATRSLAQLVQRLVHKPTLMISASAIGYYGHQGEATVYEHTQPNEGFTHTLCHLWEQEAMRLTTWGVQVMIIRLGVVLGTQGGMMASVLPSFKMGLGGRLGTGKQYLSWVHWVDVVRAIRFLLEKQPKAQVYNLTAPGPVTNAEWTQVLSEVLHKPARLPLPECLVRTLFGEMGQVLLLEGQKVMPEHLMQAQFQFQYPELKPALTQLLSEHKP